ncbi:MAG: hypothetical protein KAJ19_09820 [Gammaproteobacteria bacterium]|nr:hypothetical protein [Gammaproteobacteria bacterium]
MKNLIAVIRASNGQIALALYSDGKRIEINPVTFFERNGIVNVKGLSPTDTLFVDYPGFTQYLSAYQGIIDTMRYLMPFTKKGYSVNILTNQKVVVKQLSGLIKINKPELQAAKDIVTSLQNGAFSLQSVAPARIAKGIS